VNTPIDITERVFGNRNMTLSEYLIFLATSAHTSQECISGFVDDFSILTHAHVVLPPEVQHQATHHYRLHWMHYIPNHHGRIIVVYLEDKEGNAWIGSWDCEAMRYRITPCNMKMGSTLISPCADFPYAETTTHNCGPMMVHPKDKSPIVPCIIEVFEEDFRKGEKKVATLTFLKWSQHRWTLEDEYSTSDPPCCNNLKPIKLSISTKKKPTWHQTDT
jgi:hypothetical protein